MANVLSGYGTFHSVQPHFLLCFTYIHNAGRVKRKGLKFPLRKWSFSHPTDNFKVSPPSCDIIDFGKTFIWLKFAHDKNISFKGIW